MKRIIPVLSALVAFFVIVSALSSCNISVGPINMYFSTYENAEKYTSGNFSYDGSEVEKIDIDWVNAEVKFVISSGDENGKFAVSEAGTFTEEKSIHSFIDDGVLYIKYCASGFDSIFVEDEQKGKALTVNIPLGIEIAVTTVSADVYLEYEGAVPEPAPFDVISIKTTSGDVLISSIECTRASITSVSGDIDLDSFVCPNANVKTVSGNVDAIMSGKTLSFETVSGDVDFSGVSESISAKTTSGDITLKFEKTSATVRFETVSGKFRTGLDYVKSADKYIFGYGECMIDVATTSGDLTIK